MADGLETTERSAEDVFLDTTNEVAEAHDAAVFESQEEPGTLIPGVEYDNLAYKAKLTDFMAFLVTKDMFLGEQVTGRGRQGEMVFQPTNQNLEALIDEFLHQ